MRNTSAPAGMDDWQASDDFSTLSRAEEVKADKDRHARAIAHGKGKIASARKVVARGQAIGVSSADASNLGNGYRKL